MSMSPNAEALVASLIKLAGLPASVGEPETHEELLHDGVAASRRLVVVCRELIKAMEGDWMETVQVRCSLLEAEAHLEKALEQLSDLMKRRANR